jgi:hypothetical protein
MKAANGRSADTKGDRRLPVWAWCLTIGYASLLLLAALWAIVERTRWALRHRTGTLLEPTARRAIVAERLASEESAPTSPARA